MPEIIQLGPELPDIVSVRSGFSTFLVPSQDRKQPDVCDDFFHDVPFEAKFSSDIPELQSMTAMPGVDGFTMKVDALYKVCGSLCVEHSGSFKN